ncbi:MAG: hypothetical protein NEHIOOID_00628 [Holosporales bacterium]
MSIFFKKVILGISIFSAIKAASVEERRVVAFDATAAKQQNTIAGFVEDYLKNSRLRFLEEEEINEIKKILLKLPKWPGGDAVRSYEFIFWEIALFNRYAGSFVFQPLLENAHALDLKKIADLKSRHPNLDDTHAAFLNLYFSKNEDQDMYAAWLISFNIDLCSLDFRNGIKFIKCYKRFSDVAAREAFKIWYDRIKKAYATFSDSKFIAANDVYHSFSDDEEPARFITWVTENPIMGCYFSKDPSICKEIYCAFQTDEERARFLWWASENPIMYCSFSKDPLIFKNIYCAFQTDEERERFITWATENPIMNYSFSEDPLTFKKIYCAFQTDEERERFITWATENPIMGFDFSEDPLIFKNIYCGFETHEERVRFVRWTIDNLSYALDNISLLPNLKELYSFFKDDEERDRFMDWANIHLEFIDYFFMRRYIYSSLLILKEIYCGFETPEEQDQFIAWIKNFKWKHKTSPFTLMQIFREPDTRLKFSQFYSIMSHYLDNLYIENYLVNGFVSQDVINQMRIAAALMAEPNASNFRKRSIQETHIDSSLPALNFEDPFMQRITQQVGFTNAHTLETYYERNAILLNRIVERRGYHADLSDAFLTVYNGEEISDHYQTNSNVIDFLEYLETEFKEDQHPLEIDGHKVSVDTAIHLIKELLGIAPRKLSIGGFGSYLARPMLYGKATDITGDVLLGQIWHLIKTSLSQQDVEKSLQTNEAVEALVRESSSRKRSVVLALLNGIDFDREKADIRCQTRITGELLKMACFYFGSDSSLRRFIADGNDVETSRPQDIEQRIANAPMKAKRIFDAVKESPRFIELYTESDKPELFELYMCYYDALYQGKTIIGEDGMPKRQKDEHVLERDASGNMVRRYNADGSLRDNPIIVYYQAEFAIMEREFTKLLKRKFHENRGLIY